MAPSPRKPVTAADATTRLSDPWRVIGNSVRAGYDTGSMARGVRFLHRIAQEAEIADHHPDIDLRYGTIHLTLSTHSAHRITEADVGLANLIAQIARELELEPLSMPEARFDVAIDALDIDKIRPFWKAVLGYKQLDDDARDLEAADLVDPAGRLPAIWFQQMDTERAGRNRIHLDFWIPHDEVEGRLSAALDAGGTLVTDEFAPSWWVLADAEGNEVCLCTWQERDDKGYVGA